MDSDLLTTSVTVGFLAPPIIAAIQRQRWSSQNKALSAFALCVLAAAGAIWWQGSFDTTNIRDTVAVVFGVAIFTYQHFWSTSGMTDSIMAKTG